MLIRKNYELIVEIASESLYIYILLAFEGTLGNIFDSFFHISYRSLDSYIVTAVGQI